MLTALQLDILLSWVVILVAAAIIIFGAFKLDKWYKKAKAKRAAKKVNK